MEISATPEVHYINDLQEIPSISSIGSRGGDHEGLLGLTGEGGSEVELASVNEHGKVAGRTVMGPETEIRSSGLTLAASVEH